ncbi:MAG: exo-beta-N-acetylmuramidase NamZ family protein [Parachlamydiaceae bacterium]
MLNQNFYVFVFYLMCMYSLVAGAAQVKVGIDVFLQRQECRELKGKRIGVVTNHTAITSQHLSTLDALKQLAKKEGFTIAAIFAPEHGLTGSIHAEENIDDSKDEDRIPIYGLYGKTRRPTEAMLKNLDVLVYDIQDIGSRSYTYISTLFYVMEAAAKEKIPLIVLDRPNPINGVVVDGPMLQSRWRSIVGYINVPYCHGMTIGELALLFNEEYKIGCRLTVIPMQYWRREMSFKETELMWMPTSPHIPEASTALYYPVTGLLGELSLVNIGVGYTLPFKIVGAPWIHAKQFAKALNGQKFPGVHFEPFHFKPFFGKFSQEECHGVLITITDPLCYRPVATQYLIIGILKSLYPTHFKEAIKNSKGRKEMFCKVTGNDVIYKVIAEESNIVWKLRGYDEKERNAFLPIRKKYLIEEYGG